MLLASAAIIQNRGGLHRFSILPIAMGFAGISITRLRRELRAWFVFFLIIIGVYAHRSWLRLAAGLLASCIQGCSKESGSPGACSCSHLCRFQLRTRPRELPDSVVAEPTAISAALPHRVMAGLTMRRAARAG
jgi:hypothetical protein